MRTQIYLLFSQFTVFFYFSKFVTTNPIIGHNIKNARMIDFPFVVAIMRISNDNNERRAYQSCTGSLISNRDVLTAAHCLDIDSTHPIQVISGSNDIRIGKKYSTSWWIVYHEWVMYKELGEKLDDHDIGIIRLSQNVTDEKVVISPLWTSPNFDVNRLDVRIAGWGLTNDGSHPSILQTVNLKILKRTDCERRMSTLLHTTVKGDERFLCTLAEPYALVNLGDSGGPLMYRDAIIGVNRGTCPYSAPDSEKVNLHFALSFYKDFIEDVVTNFIH